MNEATRTDMELNRLRAQADVIAAREEVAGGHRSFDVSCDDGVYMLRDVTANRRLRASDDPDDIAAALGVVAAKSKPGANVSGGFMSARALDRMFKTDGRKESCTPPPHHYDPSLNLH